MKDYPIDRFSLVVVWPMETATRVKSKALKVFLILAYFPWFVACLPIIGVLLPVSVAMMIWDDVNGREP